MAPEERGPERNAELDALRAAWRSLDAPERGGELADEDDATRASVAWLRGAWRSLEAPAPARAPLADRRAPLLRYAAWATLAAAAGLALLLSTSDRERGAAAPSVEAPGDDAVVAVLPPVAPARRALLEDVQDGAVVLRSGSVRLYLAAPFEPAGTDANDTNERMETR